MTLTLRARVQGGRIIVDETVDPPEGAELHLAVVDGADELDDAERARLESAIDAARAEATRGEVVNADDYRAEPPSRHGR